MVFFLVNLPFYALAWQRMGGRFTLKTFAAVALLSLWVHFVPGWMEIGVLSHGFAAAAGGLPMGSGMLMLFRHRTSLGGFNVLVMYLQERFGWRAGHLQMALDCAIVLAAFSARAPPQIAWSVLGAVVHNLMLAINHRPGRWMAFCAGQPAKLADSRHVVFFSYRPDAGFGWNGGGGHGAIAFVIAQNL